MEPQQHVQLLSRAPGPRICEDSEEFRAALDDYPGQGLLEPRGTQPLGGRGPLGASEQLERMLASAAAPAAPAGRAWKSLLSRQTDANALPATAIENPRAAIANQD